MKNRTEYQQEGWDQVNGLDASEALIGTGGLFVSGAVAIDLISNPVGWAVGIGIGVYFGARLIYDISNGQ